MTIKKVCIENFRSIEQLEFEPTMLNALIGRNNVGKSNILGAIELLLGEKWPPYAIQEGDVRNHNEDIDCKIELYFSNPIAHRYYGTDIYVDGFKLEFSAIRGVNLSCIDNNGNEVLTQYGKPLALSNAIRNKVPAVLVGVDRNLSKILTASQWTILGKILKDISEEFRNDQSKVDEFCQKMNEACDILKIDSFKHLEEIIVENVKNMTGFSDVSIKFKGPNVLSHYRNLELRVKESQDYDEFSALEMGAGIQSAIVIALINAYKTLKRTGAILLIEEPEVYLHPHARRYFYSLLRELSEQGNQIFYTTHSTEFVDLSNYNTINIVKKSIEHGTKIDQAIGLTISEGSKTQLKLLTQFDSTRNEMFFSNKVLLVEGTTERFSLPFLLKSKNIDINKEGISIVDSGGKENLEFIINIIRAFSIPFIVLHDEDRNASNYNTYHAGPNGLNTKIQRMAGNHSLVFKMDPDFETIFNLPKSGDKVKNAIEKVKDMDSEDIPQVVTDAIDKLMGL